MIYRDNIRSCPACHHALEWVASLGHRFERCRRCEGLFVAEDVLRCMFSDMGPYVAMPDPHPGAFTTVPRACPSCHERMAHVGLGGVAVERCHRHGFWFDGRELEHALRAAANASESRGDLSDEVIGVVERLWSFVRQ